MGSRQNERINGKTKLKMRNELLELPVVLDDLLNNSSVQQSPKYLNTADTLISERNIPSPFSENGNNNFIYQNFD